MYFQFAQIITSLVNFYSFLVVIYCLLSWFPIRQGGLLSDVAAVLHRVCEPYLGFFRRLIPPMGGLDFSPVIAIMILSVLERLVLRVLTAIML